MRLSRLGSEISLAKKKVDSTVMEYTRGRTALEFEVLAKFARREFDKFLELA